MATDATDVVTVSYKTTCSVKVSRYLPRMTAELLMLLNHWNKQFASCFTIRFYHRVLCLENCFIKISLALLKVSEQFTIDLFFFLLFWSNKGLSANSLLFFYWCLRSLCKNFSAFSFLSFFLFQTQFLFRSVSCRKFLHHTTQCHVFCVCFVFRLNCLFVQWFLPCLSKAVEGLRRSSLWNTAKHWICIQIRTTYWSDLMRKIWFVPFRLSRQKLNRKSYTQVFKSRPLLPAVWA